MTTNDKSRRSKNRFTVGKGIKILLLLLIIAGVTAGGVLGTAVIAVVEDSPEIDPTNILSSLDQTSSIYDPNGVLIEKIQAEELRTIVSIKQIPKNLINAVIAIEDERFEQHNGVDLRGIGGAIYDNIKSGGLRGASTITQQLVKNEYLTKDVKITRKLTEMYLAMKVETVLSKDQILEAYLNRNYFGQNAYGVQEASRTYFSKDVGELTLAESALIAGIVKSTTQFQPYYRVKPEDFNPDKHIEVGKIEVLGEKYIAVFNEESIKRQRIVLAQMLKLEKITQQEYDNALKEDMVAALHPEQKKPQDITSYFADLVKTQVVRKMIDEKGMTKSQAEQMLFSGGLSIYATIDMEMQKTLEEIYRNFTQILVGNVENVRGPIIVDWSLNKAGNVIDSKGQIVYYKKDLLLTDTYDLILGSSEYKLDNGNLIINTDKITPYPKHFDVADFFTIDDRKNLVSHTVGSIVVPEGKFEINGNEITIYKEFLDANKEFYAIIEDTMYINNRYFFVQKEGIVQPQSATVILDYKTGNIKAVVGGRDVDGNRILNRATDSQRQPGSAIKPIAVYWPALDKGYTAASPIDDIPFYNGSGTRWPRNWYNSYRGIHTLRRSVEQSVNVNSVKTLQSIGIDTSISYLKKMGIINTEHPERDSFVSAAENRAVNDENLSSLGLGGMTKGLSPLELTAAYGAIANGGVYIEPIAFTKVLDKNGNVYIDNTPKESIVTTPQVAYVMGDILRTVVANGTSGRARMNNMVVAGKTGTTQNQADIWFVGYTPYYVTGTWIGNDSPRITLTRGSATAAQLWQYINTKTHEGLESKTSFPKPEGIVTATICTQSGKLPGPLCSRDPRGVVRSEIFVAGTVPKQTCDVHVEAKIDKTNNKLANEFCPEEDVETRVFIQRTPPYIPSDHGGVVPSDYQYQVPTEVCTDHDESTVIETPILDWLNDWLDSINNGNNEGQEPVPPEQPEQPGNGNGNGNGSGNGNGNGN